MQFEPTITAVLGGTNTGKTHYAVERMLARSSGVIGLPLRLLAREVYERAVREKGAAACALITGEEKIIPPHARFLICTAEAMPMADIRVGKFASVVIDEVQMIDHPQRGHIFTDRLLHARGTEETLLLGANTARPLIEKLVPDARFMNRDRFSVLSYGGHMKLSLLPKRTVVVAFSAGEVYALAELMRRNYGGAALVMGSLSPRTRNAQAALYQSGEVDYMVATDAIGMGLNLDADHVAFASLRKFDGERKRYLSAAETAQIAGRAGRFRNDGSFGTTGSCLPIDDDIIGRIENNSFAPVPHAQWRSTALDFSTIRALKNSLATPPKLKGLRRIAPATDELVLSRLCKLHDIEADIHSNHDVKTLWEVCQIPDFPDLGPEAHARLLDNIHINLREGGGTLPDAFMMQNISRLDEIGGTIEMLSSRLANIRTWTYIAHKKNWLLGHKDWVNLAQMVETRLSDALHMKLVDKFVDRRTSVLLKGIGEKLDMDVDVSPDGKVTANDQLLGQLDGLLFTQVKTDGELETKAVKQAAQKALAPEIDRRLTQIAGSGQGAISLSDHGEVLWAGKPVGKLMVGDEFFKPKIELIGGELGNEVLRRAALGRLADFIRLEIDQKLACLFALRDFAKSPTSFKDARAMAHMLFENKGHLDLRKHHKLVKETSSQARGYIRNLGGISGYNYMYMQDLMKPAPARLLSILFAFAWDKDGGGKGDPFFPSNGMTSLPALPNFSEPTLNMAGYTRRGPRIIRFDIMNRITDIIFRAMKDRNDDGRFVIKKQMLALLGCNVEDFEAFLSTLGYKKIAQKFTPVEEKAHQEYVLAYFERQALIRAAKEKGENIAATLPPLIEKPAGPVVEKGHPDYVPKRQRKRQIVLEDYVAVPQADENGQPVFETHLVLWRRTSRKKKKPSRYRPSHHTGGEHENETDNAPKTKPGADAPIFKPAPRKRRDMSGYADFAATTKSGTSEPGKARTTKIRRRPGSQKAPIQTSWAPPKRKGGTDNAAASPFAALAGLKFDEKDKPASENKPKSKNKKKTKPNNKAGKS